MEMMKAGVVHAPFDIRCEEIEKPVPQPGEILIKVKYTGICGSDIPRVNGEASHFYPNVLGHEFSGVVEALGEGVTEFAPGDRVSGIPLLPCMACEDCQRGNYSLCKRYKFIGSSRFGSFAEYVAVPARNAVKFSEDVEFEKAAFFEPATIALHGLLRVPLSRRKEGRHTGRGQHRHADDAVGEDLRRGGAVRVRHRAGKAGGGAPSGRDPRRQHPRKGFHGSGQGDHRAGAGFDFVYETAGNTITMRMAFELAANRANVCFIGTPTRELSFSVKEWENINRKEFTLTGSWMSYSAPFPGEEWKLAAHFMGTGELKVEDSFIYKIVPLTQIADAFEEFRTPGQVKGKILIDSER